jgi:hypothetical protein
MWTRGVLSESNWDAQSANNHYFEHDWTPNWAVHRWLLNELQRHWVFLTPRLGVFPLLKSADDRCAGALFGA